MRSAAITPSSRASSTGEPCSPGRCSWRSTRSRSRSRCRACSILAVVGGWLFGWLHGTIYVAVAATILAASAVFLLARSALGASLRERAGPTLQRFAARLPRQRAELRLRAAPHAGLPLCAWSTRCRRPAACACAPSCSRAFLGRSAEHVLLAQFGSGLGEVLAQGSAIRLSQLSDAADPDSRSPASARWRCCRCCTAPFRRAGGRDRKGEPSAPSGRQYLPAPPAEPDAQQYRRPRTPSPTARRP